MAHWRHNPARVQGRYTIEVSKIKAIFIYPTLMQAEVMVENGVNVASVGLAQAAEANIGDDRVTSSGAYDDKDLERSYTVVVSAGGMLGAAQITWTVDRGDDNGGPITVPNVGIASIGTHGIQVIFDAGPDLVLSSNNKWRIQGQVRFEAISALSQQVVLRGADLVPIAVMPPEATQPTFAASLMKVAHDAAASFLGWTGQTKALTEV